MNFGSYRQHLLVQPEGEIALFAVVRNFSQWFFDLLRNFVLVGGLKDFAEKSGSTILFYLHTFALVVILLYCLSYADQWYINLFSFLENKRLAHILNRAVNFGAAVALFLIIGWARPSSSPRSPTPRFRGGVTAWRLRPRSADP